LLVQAFAVAELKKYGLRVGALRDPAAFVRFVEQRVDREREVQA